MKFVLYNLATAKEAWADEASELYKKRFPFYSLRDSNVKSKKIGP